MATVGDLIASIYNHTLGGRRGSYVNRPTTTVSAGATSFDLAYSIAAIHPGDVLEIGDEQMVVVAKAAPQVTVIRGFNATTAVEHYASELVYVNPVLGQQHVRNTLAQAIDGLHPDLFSVTAQNFTTSDGVFSYEVTGVLDDADTFAFLGATIGPHTGDTRAITSPVKARLVRNAAGSMTVMLSENPGDGRALRVAVGQRFDTSNMADDRDMVADLGLDPTWRDIVEYDTAWRLVGPLESQRALADRLASSSDIASVQHGARAAAAAWFQKRARERRAEAGMELRGRYPFVQEG